ncbi:MAG: type II toxin-antitoxin system HicB family antitoxin [Spirochaetales bacterium]|nr:type II toxin-antitoxin system HicB family antitoxin [Spirochaetales bacterium]
MERHFTLEYWLDDGWYVGRIKEIPGVFSQGETLTELEENIIDAYTMVIEENSQIDINLEIKTKDFVVQI